MTAANLRPSTGRRLSTGATIRPFYDPEHPLYRDEIAEDPDALLMAYTMWLDQNGQLAELPPEVADDMNDLVNHFLAERREARAIGGAD